MVDIILIGLLVGIVSFYGVIGCFSSVVGFVGIVDNDMSVNMYRREIRITDLADLLFTIEIEIRWY